MLQHTFASATDDKTQIFDKMQSFLGEDNEAERK